MIRVKDIIIPEGITGKNGNVEYYLTNYPQFASEIPDGWVVLNKILTGCGATTFFLEIDRPLILCSHRLELLECKAKSDRHIGKVHLFNTDSDKDVNMSLLHKYLDEQRNNPFNSHVYAPKILTTVDSLQHVNSVLRSRGEIERYRVVSDEMQCLFTDAAFKGDVVLNYLQDLKAYQNVIFLSATTYLEKYMNQIPEFNNAQYQEICWCPNAMVTPRLTTHKVQSLRIAANTVIRKYQKQGYFEEICPEGITYRATKAVFYFNDVTEIINIINDNKLDINDCNIICSKTNPKTLNKLKAKGYQVGSAQKRGEEHKTFTFITKAAYEGIDLYHTDAYTYIFCDPNREHLALDLSIDIKQILGRQRLKENPFQIYANIYFKLTDSDKLETDEEFEKYIDEKNSFTEAEIAMTNSYSGEMKKHKIQQIKDSHAASGFKNDYISIRTDKATGEVFAIVNRLVKINEIRAFDIKRNDFANGIRLFNVLGEQATLYTDINSSVYDLIKTFNETRDFVKRMKAYCECRCPENEAEIEGNVEIPSEYHRYYRLLGHEGIRRCCYQESKIKDTLKSNIHDLKVLIYSAFKTGQEYEKVWIKSKLAETYQSVGYCKTPKATDLENYFILKDNKKKRSFTIVSTK